MRCSKLSPKLIHSQFTIEMSCRNLERCDQNQCFYISIDGKWRDESEDVRTFVIRCGTQKLCAKYEFEWLYSLVLISFSNFREKLVDHYNFNLSRIKAQTMGYLMVPRILKKPRTAVLKIESKIHPCHHMQKSHSCGTNDGVYGMHKLWTQFSTPQSPAFLKGT